MSPFGLIRDRFVHISRRSICDECVHSAICVCLESRCAECDLFLPKELIFNRCRCCGASYEVHRAWKNDFLDECLECNEKRKRARLMA